MINAMTDSASLGLAYTLGIGLAILVAFLIIFEALRRAFPDLYYWRNRATVYPEYFDANGVPLGSASVPGAFWPLTVASYPTSTLLETHGPDAVVFLRFLSSQFQTLSILAIFTLFVLVPTYATASNKDLDATDPDRTVGVQVLSLANVAVKDRRLWLEVLRELSLPSELLKTLVQQNRLVNSIFKVVFFADLIVVGIILFFHYRDILYFVSIRRRYRASRNPSNYGILVYDLPKRSRDETTIFALFDRLFPGEVVAVNCVRDARALCSLKTKYKNAMIQLEAAELHSRTASTDRTVRTGLHCIPAAQYWCNEQHRLAEKVNTAEQDLDLTAPLTHAAIVVFRSKRTATTAAMTNLWHNNIKYKIKRVPEPNAVNWDRMYITNLTARVRYCAAVGVLLTIAIFWFAPVLVIQSLSNFQELAKLDGLEFLADMKRNVPGFVKFLEGFLPPVLLFVLNLLVPAMFCFVMSFSRIFSRAEQDSTIRNYLFIFYLVTTFLANVLVGSVLGAIDTIINDPSASKVVSLLSTTVPAQGTFFCQYVLLNTFLGAGVGLLLPGRLLLRAVLQARARTERQIRRANAVLSSTPVFRLMSVGLVISLICNVYSSIAPIICIIGTAYFGVAYLCTKHALMYSDVQQYGSGGIMFRDEWLGVIFGVFTHQVIMTGLFSLKGVYPLVILEVLILMGTVSYVRYCRKRFWSVLEHGSLPDQLDAEDEQDSGDSVPGHYPDMYLHPGLKPISELAGTAQILRDEEEPAQKYSR